MTSFLQSLASYVFDKYQQDLSKICMVFPNRRAGLFFTSYLSELIDRPVWKPVIYTISDLMSDLSGLEYADDIDLLFELFSIHKQEKKSQESFDEFYQWGEIMLSDFDDLDKYLVNTSDLFQNLASVKDIDKKFDYLTKEQIQIIQRFWKSFDPGSQGVHQNRFLQVWDVLDSIYKKFTGSLLKKGTAYEGLIYRQVATAIKEGNYSDVRFDKLIIAGFNALNKCEDVLFEYLRNNSKADFFWDYDDYYINNDKQEAGRFIRKLLQKYPSPVSGMSSRQLGNPGKDISIYPIPSDAGQARMIPLILDKLQAGSAEDFHDTAIVLADEHLLVSVLHSLPDRIKDINVTMGYPVSQTTLNSLLELMLVMQKNAGEHKGTGHFFYRDVLAILNHQNLRGLFHQERNLLIEQITSENLIRVEEEILQVNELFTEIFRLIPGDMTYPAWLMRVLESISSETSKEGIQLSNIEQEHLYHIYLRLRNLDKVISGSGIELGIGTFYRLFRKSVSSGRIPFIGEPLSGIQVMGVLETRLLDFKNVILLSMNEGYFPKASASPSFIPHYLRFAFGLPTIEHQDAIYAYYFYRLIQRAETASLVYNNNTDGLVKGEPSRFLHQLQYDPQVKTIKTPVGFYVRINRPEPVSIKKTPEILGRLDKYHSGEQEKYLSPSALNTYLECGLRFFFSYIAGIRENDVVEEEIDSPVFGTIFHEAITELYKPLTGRDITEADMQALIASEKKHAAAVLGAFRKNLGSARKSGQAELGGKNLLISEVLMQYVRNVLNEDLRQTPLAMVEMEELHRIEVPISSSGTSRKVRLGGRIDRVDSVKGCTRILDYKTGSASGEINSMEGLFSRHDKDRNKAAFQVLLYCRLYGPSGAGINNPLLPGLYVMKDMYSPTYDYAIKMGEPYKTKYAVGYDDVKTVFEDELIRLIEEIYNADVSFTQTLDQRSCTYCPYAGVCKRDLVNNQF